MNKNKANHKIDSKVSPLRASPEASGGEGILEVATLNIKKGQSKAFENAFKKAQEIIASMNGYISHELKKCVEEEDKYILLVRWETIEDHEIGFRKSTEYQEWKRLLHHFYEPFPIVEHYK